MKTYQISNATKDPGTFIATFFDLDGETLNRFELPTELRHDPRLDTFPEPDPFAVIGVLYDHFGAFADFTALAALDNIREYYNTFYRDVMFPHYEQQTGEAWEARERCRSQMNDMQAVILDMANRMDDLFQTGPTECLKAFSDRLMRAGCAFKTETATVKGDRPNTKTTMKSQANV